MNKYVVDTEVIREAVSQLKELEKECEENSKQKKPCSEDDKGHTHESIATVCESVIFTWKELSVLMKKTISFLGKDSEKIDEADKIGANAISVYEKIPGAK